jgi:hypothetical protein
MHIKLSLIKEIVTGFVPMVKEGWLLIALRFQSGKVSIHTHTHTLICSLVVLIKN